MMAPIIRAVQVLVRFALRLLGPRKPTHPLSATQALRGAIAGGEPGSVPRFKRLHMAGMAINVAQLAVVASTLPGLAA